ncbi:MAG: phospho-N-acetylmuramoyl-pentapeptide-transferase [SAR324 cluster bacterium]|nr:phospho-N-acetylmuramoyl-pentapeptide-transferase [SAR324 cluster bacterium]
MLAELLYQIWPYQIFKSVLFRAGLSFLSTYWIIIAVMPPIIRLFRRKGITADFVAPEPAAPAPYAGAKPIMGGGPLILAIVISVLLWVEWNQFIGALLIIMLAFGSIGAWDDIAKILHRIRVNKGVEKQKSYTDKADGVSGRVRLLAEVVVAFVVVVGLYRFVDIDGQLVVPFIPLKWWYPYLPREFFVPFMVLIVVAGANAVNLTDGMDSLATVPIMTCTLFVAAVAYMGAEPEFARRLKLPLLSPDLRELVIFSSAMLSAGLAFLRYNAPPAMITMGDMGALALGSTFSAMFIFAKAELFLPLVGGVLVLTTLSTIIQRGFFKIMLWAKGREEAERIRFFYRAPYHHHLQSLWTYSESERKVVSAWVEMLKKVGIHPPGSEDQLMRSENVNSRVVWRMHMISILLFVLALVVYFKVR